MRPRKRSLHELPYTEIAKSGTLVWIIEAMGAHYHPSSIADLVGLEAKGLELDLAVLLTWLDWKPKDSNLIWQCC